MPVDPIRIEGLRELQGSLKKMDGESQKQLRLVLNEAAELVVSGARALVPQHSGRAAASLKVASSQREARVKGGGGRAPYYSWLDYGGAVGRHHSVHRPFVKEGRYIYATYNARRAQIEDVLERGLTKVITDSGLEAS